MPSSRLPATIDVRCSELQPLPVHLDGWQRRVLAPDDRPVKMRAVERTETSSGWPVTLVRSDEVDADGAVITARLHGFYVLVDRGCVVSVVGLDDAAVEAARAMLLGADVDWSSDELVALVQLWQP